MNKEETINFLLEHFMEKLVESGHRPDPGAYYAIEACLRFAARAAIDMGVSIEDLKKQLEEQWKWNEDDMAEDYPPKDMLN